ncbi:phosphoglucosamine mutase [Candidatus Mycalebacterium sp.]
MPLKLFGTDGIRGHSGNFPIDKIGSRKIGFVIAQTLAKQVDAPQVVIGRDTRKNGDKLQEALCKGLISGGATTVCAGVCPTPAVVSLIFQNRADAGIMISASHNPPEYNGFKIFNAEGFKIPDEIEREIEERFEKLSEPPPEPEKPVNSNEEPKWREAYSRSLESSAKGVRDFFEIKIALDCANGAMSEIAPEVFEKTGAKLSVIGREPDGKNINKGCGSLETALLGHEIRQSGALFGAALDGDGDRVAFCDENGNEVDGDIILALFAREMFKNGMLKKPQIVATVMSNKGLEIFLEEIGIKLLRTNVGDRNVADMMRSSGVNFGGEQSGHLIFSDHSTNGDGLLAALLAADIVKKNNKPLSRLLPKFELFPQILKNVKISRREPFDTMPELPQTVAKLEKQLGKSGRILTRYSGTEPLARILIEGENSDAIEQAASELAGIIERRIG